MSSISSPKTLLGTFRSRLLEAGVQNYEVNEEPVWHATLTLPGLSFESMDRDGKPKMQSLMMFGSVARLYALNVPYDEYGSTLFDWETLTKDALGFAAATEISVTRNIYDRKIGKKSFNAKFMLGHVGNTSVTSLTQLFVPGVSKPVLHQTNCIVTVSRQTRKAIPLPDWFKERYLGKGCMDQGLRIPPLQRPANTFVYSFIVAWSDTDNYNHTNFSSYVRFAIDGLHGGILDKELKSPGVTAEDNSSASCEASQNMPLKGITKEIIRNGLKNIKVLYLSESTEGQELEAHIWQESGDVHVVKCAIEGQGKDICHLTLEYYDDNP